MIQIGGYRHFFAYSTYVIGIIGGMKKDTGFTSALIQSTDSLIQPSGSQRPLVERRSWQQRCECDCALG